MCGIIIKLRQTMKKTFLLGAMVCALGMMTACKSGTANENTIDSTQIQTDIFVYDTLDNWLTIGIPIQRVIEKMGEPDSIGDIETWEMSGWDYRFYRFDRCGASFYTEIDEESEKVYDINIHNGSPLRTSRGVRVGDSRQTVMQRYADCIKQKQDNSMLYVNDIYQGTFFFFDNDKLMQISIGALAE